MEAKVLINLSILLLISTLNGIRSEDRLPATQVKRCSGDKPFPLEVRIEGCVVPPCNVYKGAVAELEIDLVANTFVTNATTLVKATTLGIITVPYELPKDVADICSNLMYDAYCPLYPTEDVTYLFKFPIGAYPEIGVKIETNLVDQNREVISCFVCDIKIKKGSGGAIYELNYLE